MNRAKSALSTLGSLFAGIAGKGARAISLIPPYLSHLPYLLSQEYRELAREAYSNNAAVYAVLRFLSASVAEPPLIPYVRQPDGEIGDPLPWAHPLRTLIRAPNPYLTEFEHYELMTLHVGITGRYTGWKERDRLGRPIALWPLRPDRVGPIYGDATQGEPMLLGWSYLVPGTTQYLGIPEGDIINVVLPDPAGQSGGLVEGLGPLQVLASEVSIDNQATSFLGALLANHAQPGTVIQVKGRITDQDSARLIKQNFMRDFSGSKRGEPAVIDEGSTIAPVGFSLQQLEFPALRKVSESRIAAAFGVPAILAGLLVGLEAGIKATTDELRAMFAKTTLPIYWRRYAESFSNQLANEFGEDIVCEFDLSKVKALAADSAVELGKIEDGFTNGAVTVNEYREALNLEPRDDGDVYVYGIARGQGTEVPVSGSTPSSTALPAEAPVDSESTAASQPMNTARAVRARPTSEDQEAQKLLAKALDERMAKALGPKKPTQNGH